MLKCPVCDNWTFYSVEGCHFCGEPLSGIKDEDRKKYYGERLRCLYCKSIFFSRYLKKKLGFPVCPVCGLDDKLEVIG